MDPGNRARNAQKQLARRRTTQPGAAERSVLETISGHARNRGSRHHLQNRNQQEPESFALVYKAYREISLIDENPYELRVTPYHLLDTTQVFVATYRNAVICTVSLIIDGEMGVPAESIYGAEIEALRASGFRFGEVSCLADRRRKLGRILPVFVKLSRVMAQYAQRQNVDGFIVAVHPKHARFYKRFMGFEPIGDQKSYPMVNNNPAVASCLDFRKASKQTPNLYREYFGDPLPEEVIQSHEMDPAEKEHLSKVAEFAGSSLAICDE